MQTVYPDNYYVNYTRDPMGLATNVVDASGSSLTNWYNNQGLLVTSSNAFGQVSATLYDILDRPISVSEANGVTVSIAYDNLNRVLTRTYPDTGVEQFGYTPSIPGPTCYTNQLSQVTRYGYDFAGRKTAETNANLEEIHFEYDQAGNLKSLTDGKNQTTRWAYDLYGRVTNKLDQAGVEILRYRYDAEGRLTNRWSKAKGDTAYTFDAVGNLTFINYPSSPDVTFAYDPLNRLTNMVDAVGTTAYRYTVGGQLLSEDGPWTSDTVTNTYANRLRTGLGLQQPTGAWTNGFAYDNAGRLTGVVSPAGSFDYLLTGAGSEVRRLALPNGGYITNTFDPVARQLSTALKNSSHTTLTSHAYTYNLAGQRTQQAYAGGDTVDYSYDPIGQLQVADSSVAWQDRGYLYDAAWNLNYRTNSGVLVTAYQVDSRNQLTSAGSQTCVYDDNGNLVEASTGSSLTAYVYDDENRLVRITNGPPASPPPQVAPMRPSPLPGWRTDLVYDGLGRLRIRHEYSNTVNGWWLDGTTLYLYDGNRVIQERNGTMVPTVSYTRGTDLSGSLEGAGGIGGLLARSTGNGSTWTSHAYYHADGNGNITTLLDGTQSVVAAYRYDPFGNALAKTGTLADANLYRFSSKELHAKSGLYYYLYRFYDPNLQRWINRDPLGDEASFPQVTSVVQARTFPDTSLQDLVMLQRLRSPLDAFTRINGNLARFASNRPVDSYDPTGLYAPCQYGCTRFSTLLPLFVCIHLATDTTDCPSCPPVELIGAITGRYRIFFVTSIPCPVCKEHDKPEPGA